jgi:multiple sugar transport system permease protein
MSVARTLNHPQARTNPRRANSRLMLALGFLLPALLVFVLFTYYPLVTVIRMSFTDSDMMKPNPNFVGLENYTKLFASRDFWSSLTITAIFAIGVTVLEVGLGMALGFLMNAPTRLQGLLRGAVFTPTVISISATAVLWSFFLNPQGGPVNRILESVGLPGSGWLTDPNMALASVILIAVWKGVGLPAVLYMAGLQGISRELEEAAVVDGASRWQVATRVTIPLLAPTTMVVFFLSLVGTFQSYGLVLLLTQGGPVGSTTLLGYYIYQNAFQFFQMGYASAISVVLFLLLLVLAYLQFRVSERRVHYQ